MDFNKNEMHILKYLRSYRLLSIGCMIFGGVGIPFGFYNYYIHNRPYSGAYLNNALIAASFVVVALGYLMYCLTNIIHKYENGDGAQL